jgi:hypothetical protein
VRFIFSADEAAIRAALEELEANMRAAAEGAVQDAAMLAVKEGRANIAAAGFPEKAQRELSFRFFPNPGGNPSALIFDTMPFASVFERGVNIGGHPLLWLPIEQNLPPNVHSPRQYGRKMISVNVAGKPPLLFDAANRLLGPLFVGVRSASIRKRFDLYRIFAAAAAKLQDFYDQRFKG